MDSEGQFWTNIWSIAAITFIVFCAIVAGCTVQKNSAIASSRDPIATACALGKGDEPICIQKGTKQ